jgi:hypothetical protein
MRAVIAKVAVGAAESHRIITANRDLAKDYSTGVNALFNDR